MGTEHADPGIIKTSRRTEFNHRDGKGTETGLSVASFSHEFSKTLFQRIQDTDTHTNLSLILLTCTMVFLKDPTIYAKGKVGGNDPLRNDPLKDCKFFL